MHIVPRSQSGMGVEQNGALGCVWHHNMMDNGNRGNRNEMISMLEERMRRIYPGWTREQVTYRKGAVDPAAGREMPAAGQEETAEREGAEVQGGSRRDGPPEGFRFVEEIAEE